MVSTDGQARDAKPDAYVVAGCTPWARRVFDQRLSKLSGEWAYVETPLALEEAVRAFAPRLVFVLHWRWRVPRWMLEEAEYVGFHLGSFARYRGGTPLQHQILAGESVSMLTMYRMSGDLDAGPVYTTVPVPLHGSAEAVYAQAMDAAADKIALFVGCPWSPKYNAVVSLGNIRLRRTPAESKVPDGLPLLGTYDFIRMLDAAGYPNAFLDYGPYRLTLRRAVLYDGRVECDCTITVREEAA